MNNSNLEARQKAFAAGLERLQKETGLTLRAAPIRRKDGALFIGIEIVPLPEWTPPAPPAPPEWFQAMFDREFTRAVSELGITAPPAPPQE